MVVSSGGLLVLEATGDTHTFMSAVVCFLRLSLVVCYVALSWGRQLRHHQSSVSHDLTLLVAVAAWQLKTTERDSFLLLLPYALAYMVVMALFRAQSTFHHFAWFTKRPGVRSQQEGNAVQGPLLFPCRTNHTRLVPTKHSFSYSYLLVAIPVDWQGAIGSVFRVEHPSHRRTKTRPTTWTWFSVNPSDYLDRRQDGLGLKAKLDFFLRHENINYTSAYLVTAPRFLGYSFNPVSFWYLYDAANNLIAMILEVNNTFDERRMYLLRQPAATSNLPPSSSLSPPNVKFRSTWPKDFHVSPYNDRTGTYTLAAQDPGFRVPSVEKKINNHLTLRAHQDKVTMVASVFSTSKPLDPMLLTSWSLTKLLASWWWVGFVTFPRIVREAGKLFLKRMPGFGVHYRPEVGAQSLAREETEIERTLEAFFRQYLAYRVNHTNLPITVKYIPGLRYDTDGVYLISPHAKRLLAGKKGRDKIQQIKIKILTPVFYSRFVHYTENHKALDMELLDTRPENRTIYVSDPGLLPLLLWDVLSSDDKRQPLGHWAWSAVRLIRCSPPEQAYPAENPVTEASKGFKQHSEMDIVVAYYGTEEQKRLYRQTILELFLTDRIAFGAPALLQAYDFLIRALILWIAMRTLPVVFADMWRYGPLTAWRMLTLAAQTLWIPIVSNGVNLWARFKKSF